MKLYERPCWFCIPMLFNKNIKTKHRAKGLHCLRSLEIYNNVFNFKLKDLITTCCVTFLMTLHAVRAFSSWVSRLLGHSALFPFPLLV